MYIKKILDNNREILCLKRHLFILFESNPPYRIHMSDGTVYTINDLTDNYKEFLNVDGISLKDNCLLISRHKPFDIRLKEVLGTPDIFPVQDSNIFNRSQKMFAWLEDGVIVDGRIATDKFCNDSQMFYYLFKNNLIDLSDDICFPIQTELGANMVVYNNCDKSELRSLLAKEVMLGGSH